jgi:hypothetical protein
MTTQEYESTGTLETVAGGVGGGAYQYEGPGGGENVGGEVSQARRAITEVGLHVNLMGAAKLSSRKGGDREKQASLMS